MSSAGWIDELERDLGLAARLRLIANAGGQRRKVPAPRRASRSIVAAECGADVAIWLSRRFRSGEIIEIPTARGQEIQDRAARLAASVIEAGLTQPTRSANDLAAEHGVSVVWVRRLRAKLRQESGESAAPEVIDPRQLRLFD